MRPSDDRGKTEEHDLLHVWLSNPENQIRFLTELISHTYDAWESWDVDLLVYQDRDTGKKIAYERPHSSTLENVTDIEHARCILGRLAITIPGCSDCKTYNQSCYRCKEETRKLWTKNYTHNKEHLDQANQQYGLLRHHELVQCKYPRMLFKEAITRPTKMQELKVVMTKQSTEFPIISGTFVQGIVDVMMEFDWEQVEMIEMDADWVWKDFNLEKDKAGHIRLSDNDTVIIDLKPKLNSVSQVLGQINTYSKLIRKNKEALRAIITFDERTTYDQFLNQNKVFVYRVPMQECLV